VRKLLLLALFAASVGFCFAGGPGAMGVGVLTTRVNVLDARTDVHEVAIASHLVRLDGHDVAVASHLVRLDTHDIAVASHLVRLNADDVALASHAGTIGTAVANISSHTIDIAARALLGGNPAQSFAALNLAASGTLRVASDAAFLLNTPASTAWYPTEQ
jgi:hypothetical protein